MLIDKKHFPYFTNVIEKYFVDNYERLIDKMDKLKYLDGKIMKTFIWGHSVKINYSDLINKFKQLYETLKDKDFEDLESNSVHISNIKKQLEKDI